VSLQQAAYLRLDMPDASLQELSEASQPHVGKSGINHRLKRLEALAEELRQERFGTEGKSREDTGSRPDRRDPWKQSI